MPIHVPVPRPYAPRTPQDLVTLGARLGGQLSFRVGVKTEQTVTVDGAKVKRKLPSFIEWWLVFDDEPMSSIPPEPSAPEDPRVRALLEGLARQAARGWVKESMVAKGWPATPQPPPSAPMHAKEHAPRRRPR